MNELDKESERLNKMMEIMVEKMKEFAKEEFDLLRLDELAEQLLKPSTSKTTVTCSLLTSFLSGRNPQKLKEIMDYAEKKSREEVNADI